VSKRSVAPGHDGAVAETTRTLISEEMRGIVGQVMARATSFPISASDIRKWAAAVYFPEVPPPLFWDEEYAATTPWGGIVAPEEFNPFAWMTKDPEPKRRESTRGAFEAQLGVTPPPYKANLQSQVRVRYGGVRMRPGDVIRSTRRITDYFEREGRMGLQLYTTIALDYVNQRDEWIKTLETVYLRW
jgi:N-terminal half of MaoC dehydratase